MEEEIITWISDRVGNLMDFSEYMGTKNFILFIFLIYLVLINLAMYFYL